MTLSKPALLAAALALVAIPTTAADTTNVLAGGVAINEVLADPNSGGDNCDADSSGTAETTDEYVELHNLSGGTINIGDFQLWDAGNDNWFTFPANTMIDAGGHAVVLVGVQGGGVLPTVPTGSVAFDAALGSGVINNGGDNVVLYDPGSDQYVQLLYNGDAADNPVADYTGFSATATLVGSAEDFGSDSDGNSMARNPDGDDVIAVHGNVCATVCSPGTAVCGPVPVELQTFTID